MEYQIINANEWLYPDKRVQLGGEKKINLFCAKGSYAAVQVLLGRMSGGEKIKCALKGDIADLTSYGVRLEVYQQIDVRVNANVGPDGHQATGEDDPTPYATRLAPFRVYDCLRPLTSGCVTNRGTNALYLALEVPAGTPAGLYKGSIKLRVGEKEEKIPLRLKIFEVTIPEKGTLTVTNWFNTRNIAENCGLEQPDMDNPVYLDMLRRYALLMRRARQNMIRSPQPKWTQREDGSYEFDYSGVERYLKFFFELGFDTIEGTHVASHSREDRTRYSVVCRPELFATDPDGYAFIAQQLTAWYECLKKNGWLDRIVQHVADEPTEKDVADYRVVSGIVRKYMPGVKLMDAISYRGVNGALDVYIPTNRYYQENQEFFENLRAQGSELWCYTCTTPGGHFCNRVLDMPLLKTRYLHWGNFKYDLKGYLHWGFNRYNELAEYPQNPFEQTASGHWPGGDTHIVYPGDNRPWPSMRLEAMRAGIEDYELLVMLAKKKPERAHELCDEVMRAFDDVQLDVDIFEFTRKQVLAELAGESVAEAQEE